MKRESNHKLYMELKDRPADWSEAKQMAGVEMVRGGGRGKSDQQGTNATNLISCGFFRAAYVLQL